MAEPTSGLTVHDAADKLYEQMQTPEPEAQEPLEMESDQPESEPSEVEEPTSELSEEVEAETTAEPEAEGEAEIEAEGETEQFLSELNDWIKDKSHFDAIRIPTKVNGVEQEATLADLLANHQIGQASEERLNAVKAEKAEFEKAKAQEQQALSDQLNQATQLVNMLEQNFLSDVEKVNWDELRETDPAEYSARRQDLIEKQQQLNTAKQSIQTEHQKAIQEQYQAAVQRESAALLENFPSWADEAVAKIEKTAIRDYLLSSGFSTQEIDGATDADGNIVSAGVIDHRAIQLAHKAMLYDKGEKAVDVTKKKVKKLPKVAKPGKPKPINEDVEKQKKLRGRLKKSGHVDDAAALIYDSMFGG